MSSCVTGGFPTPFSPLLPIPGEHPATAKATTIIEASRHRFFKSFSARFRIKVQLPDGYASRASRIGCPTKSTRVLPLIALVSAAIRLIRSAQLGPDHHRAAHRMPSDVNVDFINRAQV